MYMFYYPIENNMLEPIDHIHARSLLAKKLKERDENGDTGAAFSIWTSQNIHCQKISSVEDLDSWVEWASQYDIPIAMKTKKRAFAK